MIPGVENAQLKTKQRGFALFLKIAFDRAIAAGALVASAPAIALAATGVRLTMGSPAFFAQERPGKHGKPIRVYKLRTMTDERDADGNPLRDELRLTPLGRFLRSTSLDELPQLFNVLKGELSLVGPRPLLMEYLELYSPEQMRRHEVLPGITGWAQINGRNTLTWEQKLAYDVWYVNNWSLALDARILLRTLAAVVRREGITNAAHATMYPFRGTSRTETIV